MKKFLAIALFAVGSMVGLQAQETKVTKKENRLELIPKAGINISNQAIKGINGEKSKVGFQGGLALNIPTGPGGFSVQPEINFVTKGTKFKVGNKEQNYNFNYLEIPVMAKYSFGPVYVNAGPSIGFQTGKDKKVKAAYGKTTSVDFGLQMGAGVAIPAGPGKLIVDGRYNLGLTDIADAKSINAKNRGFAISLGYAIPL